MTAPADADLAARLARACERLADLSDGCTILYLRLILAHVGGSDPRVARILFEELAEGSRDEPEELAA